MSRKLGFFSIGLGISGVFQLVLGLLVAADIPEAQNTPLRMGVGLVAVAVLGLLVALTLQVRSRRDRSRP